jgi:hypothetical protein
MKSRTRKSPKTDPWFAAEMAARRTRQNDRVPMFRYFPGKYKPNELPLYPKAIRAEVKAILNV